MNLATNQLDAIQEEMNAFLENLSNRPELKGTAVKFALHKPLHSENHVTTIHIGSCANDTEASVDELLGRTHIPAFGVNYRDGINVELKQQLVDQGIKQEVVE